MKINKNDSGLNFAIYFDFYTFMIAFFKWAIILWNKNPRKSIKIIFKEK